jgi:hypothetical protein
VSDTANAMAKPVLVACGTHHCDATAIAEFTDAQEVARSAMLKAAS